jgi:hypothetical protein
MSTSTLRYGVRALRSIEQAGSAASRDRPAQDISHHRRHNPPTGQTR